MVVDSRVVVVSGPSKGTVVRLAGVQLSVGRDSANDLCLHDRAVSRRHFTISETDAAFHLVDLESHNGTFVNGIPVRRKLLGHGDTIRAGHCELVFLITEDEELVSHIVQFSEEQEPVDLLSTTKLQAYPALGSFGTDVGRMARDLNALFKIANTINSIRDLEPLQQRLLQLIGEVVPADYGAIVILRHAEDEPSSSCTWHRQAGDTIATADSARHCAACVVGALGHPQPAHARVGRNRKRAVRSFGRGGKNYRSFLLPGRSVRERSSKKIMCTSSARWPAIAAVTLENVLALENLRNENRRLQAELDLGGVLIGESKGMRQVQNFIATGGQERFHGPDSRRKRYRQGAGGTRHPSQQPARR